MFNKILTFKRKSGTNRWMPDCHENIRNEKQEALKHVAGYWLLVAG
jgi:hypothetical protein